LSLLEGRGLRRRTSLVQRCQPVERVPEWSEVARRLRPGRPAVARRRDMRTPGCQDGVAGAREEILEGVSCSSIRFVKGVCDVGRMHSPTPQFLNQLGAAQGHRVPPFLLDVRSRHMGHIPVFRLFNRDHDSTFKSAPVISACFIGHVAPLLYLILPTG